MYVIDRIASYTGYVADYFYEVYLDVSGWVWPFWKAADFFYGLCSYTNKIKWRFQDFSEDMDDIVDEVGDILSWSNIRSYIKAYWPRLDDVIDWWYDRWYWVEDAIDDWWEYAKETVTQVVTNIYDYSRTTINNITEYVTNTITNVYDYSRTTINNITEYVTNVITNVYNYTTTIINNVTEVVTQLIANLESWTTTQINNARSAILGIIGDLETWTITELNNIKDTLTSVFDWDALWAWITTWWNDRLLDVQGLIDTELKTWFPFYDDLAELWNGIAEFFVNPLDWLKDRIEIWFWTARKKTRERRYPCLWFEWYSRHAQ